MTESIDQIRQAIRSGDYRLTRHAELERDADGITMDELEEAFASGMVELLEDYSDDPKGHSMLVLGFTDAGMPMHAVIGLSRSKVAFVTVYRPDPLKWDDWRWRV